MSIKMFKLLLKYNKLQSSKYSKKYFITIKKTQNSIIYRLKNERQLVKLKKILVECKLHNVHYMVTAFNGDIYNIFIPFST